MSDPRKRRIYQEADAPTDVERDEMEFLHDGEDADREMFGDEVDAFGLGNVGNK